MEYNHNPEVRFNDSFEFISDDAIIPDHGNLYFCPQNCELDKTYPFIGLCPKCNMHLVPVEKG